MEDLLRIASELTFQTADTHVNVTVPVAPLVTSRATQATVSYLATFGESASLTLFQQRGVGVKVAEIEVVLTGPGRLELTLDPALTLLSDVGGVWKATDSAGTLALSGAVIVDGPSRRRAVRQ